MITRNQERRFRIDIAIRDVMTKTFQHFLAKHILPADLINEIERRRHKHLSEEDKKTIQSGNFDKFDVTLLNKLFVNYGDIIFENGLRIVCSKEMPYPNHVTVSDDFNRLRIYRNKRKKRILTSINNLTENTKQMRKSKALLIVGEYGVGKSSFVNTVLTAITGIYHEHCQVAQASSSKTNYLDVKCPAEYLKITTDEDEKLWYPTFVDMVGMDKANFAPFDIILEYILDGKLKPFTDLTDFCNNIKKGRKMVQMEKREGPIVDAIVFLLAPKSEQNPTVLMENINIVLKRSAKEIPIFVVMTKMDECDLAEEAIRDLKRKICSSFVINMDRILECVNYKRSDSQSGWWDNDAVEKVLNFLTSICDPHLQRRDLIRMEFEKETSFIHVDGEKVTYF
uniref:Interferon-induced protein 44-like protein n=1 Tax=Magallana gigas TaxID=29159 RepID=K1R568_MAGGI